MADDSSAPPLSRRVPGATNRPKPQMRIAPPVLPEDLVDRLRPKQAAAAETTAVQPRRARDRSQAGQRKHGAKASGQPTEAPANQRAQQALAQDSPPEPAVREVPVTLPTSEEPGPEPPPEASAEEVPPKVRIQTAPVSRTPIARTPVARQHPPQDRRRGAWQLAAALWRRGAAGLSAVRSRTE